MTEHQTNEWRQSMNATYQSFVESKLRSSRPVGITDPTLSGALFDYQRAIVTWALRRGRAAIFADCGMGKTLMQLEWAREVQSHTGGAVLILCPLAVAAQTVKEASRFGITARQLRKDDGEPGIVVANYDVIDHFDVRRFSGLVLDESSILKSYDGKFRTMILDVSSTVPFRLACTATPAPNDNMELGNHAQFVGVCSREEMLATYFTHDLSGGTNDWRLKGHAVKAFWRWVATWAVSIRRPSDLGYCDDGFVMPELQINEHVVEVSHEPANGQLFRLGALSLSELRDESKRTLEDRVAKVASLVNKERGEPWIVWCHTNAESEALAAAIDGAVELTGSDHPDDKSSKMIGFSDGSVRVLVTKPSIAGFGMNWQHCARMAFVGLSHSYEQFYQAVRRSWRYGQKRPVACHVVCAETETAVLDSIKRKQRDADTMSQEMTNAMREASIHELADPASPFSDEYRRDVFAPNDNVEFHLGDCVDVWTDRESESIDMMVFSPPFASLFTYSASPRDMGNAKGDAEFHNHFGFIVEQLFRTLKSGRICAVHVMNLPTSKERDGFIGIRDFRGDVIRLFCAAGFVFHSEVTIWKDPVTAMQRTKALGLLYKQLCKDSSMSRQGFADYLCVFRKPGQSEPISTGRERFDSYIGQNGPASCKDIDLRRYSIDVWQRYASPVWFDIDQGRTLNYREAREDDDERHICPLQLDVIERAIHLWSNPGDVVASPFGGIGSELVSALRMGRRAFGAELKASYWELGCRNIEDVIAPSPQISLF